MGSTLFAALFSFVAVHASGILTGVVGTKLTGFIASHLKTDTEKKIYEDVMLPIVQSLAALLSSVPTAAASVTQAAATPVTTATVTRTATVSASALPDDVRFNN